MKEQKVSTYSAVANSHNPTRLLYEFMGVYYSRILLGVVEKILGSPGTILGTLVVFFCTKFLKTNEAILCGKDLFLAFLA